jgi:hypothetical protein
MIGETQLHFISAIVIVHAAAVPIYLTIKLKDNLKKLDKLYTIADETYFNFKRGFSIYNRDKVERRKRTYCQNSIVYYLNF